jgi:hypothetical protein
MRLAVLIVGIALSIILGLQTLFVYVLSNATSDETTGGAASVGLLVAFMMFVASALTIGLPRTAAIVFILAGLLSLMMAAASRFSDLYIWGVVSIVLGILAFIGWRGKHHAEVRAAGERKADVDRAVAAGIAAATFPHSETSP